MVKVIQMLGDELGGQKSLNSFISEASETEGFVQIEPTLQKLNAFINQ